MAAIDLILKILTAAAAVVAASVAILGLRTWRSQLIGKTEYDVARRVLRGVLEVRDQIAMVRGPFMSAGEMDAALKENRADRNLDPRREKDMQEATGLAYERRWKGLTTALADLQSNLLEGEVLWGEPIRQAHKALLSCVAELNASLSMYLRGQANPRLADRLGDKYEQYFAVVYQVSDDPSSDPFSARVAAAVTQFETILRRHLSTGVPTRRALKPPA